MVKNIISASIAFESGGPPGVLEAQCTLTHGAKDCSQPAPFQALCPPIDPLELTKVRSEGGVVRKAPVSAALGGPRRAEYMERLRRVARPEFVGDAFSLLSPSDATCVRGKRLGGGRSCMSVAVHRGGGCPPVDTSHPPPIRVGVDVFFAWNSPTPSQWSVCGVPVLSGPRHHSI